MTKKERIETALRFEEPDRPPHYEQLFQLTREAFGMEFPENNDFEGLTDTERKKLFEHTSLLYAKIIEAYDWDAMLILPPNASPPYKDPNHFGYEFIPFLKRYLQSYFNEDVPVGGFLFASMICIDVIDDYMDFSEKLYERRDEMHQWAEVMLENALLHAGQLIDAGVDYISVNSDHAFNRGTLLSPDDFRELVTPYGKKLINYIKSQGVWTILHSDGNLMGVLDQILEMGPDVLHSIDPQADMDIKEVKRLTYGKIALMGNVQCSYLQTGPIEKIIESSKYCIEHGAPGGGYIFSSSNTVFPGANLEYYKVMLNCLRQAFPDSYS